jgi:predicted TIM-barrel fold metal-dependent hydrolase
LPAASSDETIQYHQRAAECWANAGAATDETTRAEWLDLAANFTVAHTPEHPFAQMRQFTSMMFEGVFEQFPNFRFGCLECGVGWVPYMMDRMDEEQERKGHYSPRCKLKPSEYIKKGNIFFAVEVEESALPLAAQVANENALIWASDYPHERDQRDFSQDIPNLINRKDISDELKRKIFWDNPLRFYPRLRARVEKGQTQAKAAAG